MIRPEARAALLRWRGVIVWGAALLLGLYWAAGYDLLRYVGIVLVIGALAGLWTSLQRLRFLAKDDGPGVVQVVEGRISYFGPLDGGIVDLEELQAVSLNRDGKPAHWGLHRAGQSTVHVPVTAQGAEALFDALISLPGLGPGTLADALKVGGRGQSVLWRRAGVGPPAARLH